MMLRARLDWNTEAPEGNSRLERTVEQGRGREGGGGGGGVCEPLARVHLTHWTRARRFASAPPGLSACSPRPRPRLCAQGPRVSRGSSASLSVAGSLSPFPHRPRPPPSSPATQRSFRSSAPCSLREHEANRSSHVAGPCCGSRRAGSGPHIPAAGGSAASSSPVAGPMAGPPTAAWRKWVQLCRSHNIHRRKRVGSRWDGGVARWA